MLKTELKLPFVFYNALEKQHRFRSQNPFRLITPNDALLPFEIKKITGGSYTEFQLYYLDDTVAINLSGHTGLIEVKHTIDAEYLMYKGDSMGITIPNGCYYVKLTKGESWYSEVFRVTDDLTSMVQLQWFNTCDIDPVVYQTGYRNIIYLDTYTEDVLPELNEDGDENGAGEFIPTLQRMVYKHKIEFIAPDYLLDALAFMQMHDSVQVSEGGDSSEIKRVKLTADYGEFGLGMGKVEFEFPASYERTDCCANLKLTDGGGGGDTCAIEITNITNTDLEGAFQIDFTPVLNGATLDHYQWRSTSYNSNAWNDIGTLTTFTHTFPAEDVTIEIEAVCDNLVEGTIASIVIPFVPAVTYTEAFTFQVSGGNVALFNFNFGTTAGLHVKVLWDNTIPLIFSEDVTDSLGQVSFTNDYNVPLVTGTVYFETVAACTGISIDPNSDFVSISALDALTALTDFSAINNVMTSVPSLPNGIMNVNVSGNQISGDDLSAMLVQIDGFGYSASSLSDILQMDSQTPAGFLNASGLTAKTSLQGKGWSVFTD